MKRKVAAMTEPSSLPPRHKANFVGFIYPQYVSSKDSSVPDIDPDIIGLKFQAFLDSCLNVIPDEGQPADGYVYNSHMGEFVRLLDQAKDSFTKSVFAFHLARKV